MDEHIIEFKLNTDEIIIMELPDLLDEIDCCYDVPISLVQVHKKILLSLDALRDNAYCLRDILRKALHGELLLHESITADIGYLYNQYSRYISSGNSNVDNLFVSEKKESSRFWVGMRYHLWASKNFVSWLYNDRSGNIIFEVTPFYPFMYSDTKKNLKYVSFKKWILRYKPYITREISKKRAQQWLDQAIYIADRIDSNIARWKEKGRY